MKINLSEYYESILGDKMITVILAWIEVSGRITEYEIIRETGIEENELKNIVIKLYRNNLIDISNDFLSVTENGKIIVDALKLNEEIVNNSYHHLRFKSKEKKFINKSIHWYRDNFYYEYLNTFTSLKYWNRFRSEDGNKEEGEQNKSVDYLLIIFHDIIQLYAQFEKKAITFENLISYIDSKSHFGLNEDLKFSHQAYALFLDYANIKNKEDFNQYDQSRKEIFTFLKCKNYFLSDFKTQKKINGFLHDGGSSHEEDPRQMFWDYTSNWLEMDHIMPSKTPNPYVPVFFNTSHRTSANTVLDELVFIVENSNSVTDISLSTHKSISDTKDLLLRLKKGIKRLTRDQ